MKRSSVVSPVAAILVACMGPLWSACGSAEPVARAPDEAPIERISDAEGPADTNLSEPAKAPPQRDDDKKKKIEEYKALALKNDCSGGYKGLDGHWRFVGETRTPNYTGTLTVSGTRYKETLSGNPDGRYLSAEIEGEIRCLFKNRVLVQLDKVKPEGAYGNRSGDLYPCDLLSDMDPKTDRMLMICYFDWDLSTAAGMEFEYERVIDKP